MAPNHADARMCRETWSCMSSKFLVHQITWAWLGEFKKRRERQNFSLGSGYKLRVQRKKELHM